MYCVINLVICLDVVHIFYPLSFICAFRYSAQFRYIIDNSVVDQHPFIQASTFQINSYIKMMNESKVHVRVCFLNCLQFGPHRSPLFRTPVITL